MGLKQNIVIVSEYSIKHKGGGGSRGGTPGSYVLRYMARDGATEDLAPVRFEDTDAFIQRYMLRREATESHGSVSGVKSGMKKAQGNGGVAFGIAGKFDDGDISLSHNKVARMSKDIQKHFDDGKTAIKTVLSFDLEYLKKHGIVEPDFEPKEKGDYRGNIDQMKLRKAIMSGMKKMGRKFSDLEWVGVLQVDTLHVHCHLCMIDKGKGRITKDGTQKGKLSENDKRILRANIDMSLDEMSPLRTLAINVAFDRRNVRCFVKKFTHETMAVRGVPQILIACLPDDKRLWRASTNRAEMKKANAIVREYVERVFELPDSGYDTAIREIDAYAKEKVSREDLSGADYRRLLAEGRKRLVEDCMNGVYQMLKQVPDHLRTVRTPMLDIMSMDYDDLSDLTPTDPMVEFGFKLRSYSARLSHHRKERYKYRERVEAYEDAIERDEVVEDSKPLYEFYKLEEEYNAMLMAKYAYFLRFLPPSDSYEEELAKVSDYFDKLRRMDLMIADKGMKRMKPENAEKYGLDVYDMKGGSYMVLDEDILINRRNLMEETFDKMVETFEVHLEDRCMCLDVDDKGVHVRKEIAYDFDDVKALDLHHLAFDFPYDAKVAKLNVDNFVAAAAARSEALAGALEYMDKSGQMEYASELPIKDVQVMKEFADRIQSKPVLENRKKRSGGKHKGMTVSLDHDFITDMKLAVKMAIDSQDFGN